MLATSPQNSAGLLLDEQRPGLESPQHERGEQDRGGARCPECRASAAAPARRRFPRCSRPPARPRLRARRCRTPRDASTPPSRCRSDMNEAIVEPAPGRMPIEEADDRAVARTRSGSPSGPAASAAGCADPLRHRQHCPPASAAPCCASTSPIAKTPIATIDEVDAAQQLRAAEGEARGRAEEVGAHARDPQADQHREQRLRRATSPASSTTIARPSAISAKYSGELNASDSFASGGATSISADDADRAGDERGDRRDARAPRRRGPCAPSGSRRGR